MTIIIKIYYIYINWGIFDTGEQGSLVVDEFEHDLQIMKKILSGILFLLTILLAACSGGVNGLPEPRISADDPRVEDGRALIASYGCGSCHTIPGVPGADARVGPALDHFYARSFIAGRLSNTEQNLSQWIQHPQEIDPGNAMPDLGVTEEQARAISAYLYHQPSLKDFFNR